MSPHLLILVFSAIVHLVTIVKEYAWADDWAFIAGYRTSSPEIKIEHLSGLRPILQVLMDQSFGRILQYERLIFLRLISLIGLLLLVHQIMKLLNKIGYSNFVVYSFGILINFLPTFWIYTNWASVFSYTWVCLLSLLSFSVFIRSKLLGLVLIIFCFLIYQPAAVFSSFVVFAYLLKNGKLDKRNKLYLIYLIYGSLLSYLIGKLVGFIVGLSLKTRTEIVDSPVELIEKFAWITTRPVLLSMRPFIIESWGTLAAVSSFLGLSLTMVSLWQVSKRFGFSKFKFASSLISVYAVGLLPLIVISENQIEFRTLPATSCCGLFLIVEGVKFFLDKFFDVRGAAMIFGFTVVLALFSYSHHKINLIFIESFRQNHNFLNIAFSKLNLSDQIVVLIDSKRWPQQGYIGALSVESDLQMPWVPIGEISQLLELSENQITIQIFENDKKNPPGNSIDLREFRDQLTYSD